MKSPGIIFEDGNILVIDKPAGITVNRADTTIHETTLQDFVEKHLGLDSNHLESDSDFLKRAGIVHRIDKETSGLLLVAKDNASFENLQLQFKERKVKKTYIALVNGNIEQDSGEIAAPVGRLPWNRKRFGVLAGGKEAITVFKVLERFQNKYTLLEIYPKSGRTHQIRVHLKYFNHPVFADPLYGGRKVSRQQRKILPRLFLHAARISFNHPTDGREVTFESPLPKELVDTLKALRH